MVERGRLVELKFIPHTSSCRSTGHAEVRGRRRREVTSANAVLMPNGLLRARRAASNPRFEAVVGSYDDSPSDQSTISMFKNLAHHFFHQQSAGEISSFWGACGLVSRRLFTGAGGFDEKRFFEPSIEDVEFGYRLSDMGARIRIDPELRVTHLKRWTLSSLITTDVVRRAVPWTVLSLERGGLPAELNFSVRQRVAALIAPAMALCALTIPFRPLFSIVLVVLLMMAIWLNLPLYSVFRRKGGLRLMAAGFFLQQLYYLYSLGGLGAGAALFCLNRSRRALTDRGDRRGAIAP